MPIELRIVLALLALSPAALAQDLGRKGQIVPLGAASFSEVHGNGATERHLRVDPAAFLFLRDGLAAGIGVGFGYDTPGVEQGFAVAHVISWAVAPAVAAALPIADRLALFPQVGLRLAWGDYSGQGVERSIAAQAFAPVVFVPAPHFFLGAGPALSWALDGVDAGRVAWGLSTVIGGWL